MYLLIKASIISIGDIGDRPIGDCLPVPSLQPVEAITTTQDLTNIFMGIIGAYEASRKAKSTRMADNLDKPWDQASNA
eukprot:scaffold38969_cov14-Prasinocladus_malaysianus.AAC.1